MFIVCASFSPLITPPFLTFVITVCSKPLSPFFLTFPVLLCLLSDALLWFLPLCLSSPRQLPSLSPRPLWLSSFFYSLWLTPTFSISPSSHILSFVIVAQSSFVHPASGFFKFLYFTLTSPSRSPGAHPYPQFSCSHSFTYISITILCVSHSPLPYTHIYHHFLPPYHWGKSYWNEVLGRTKFLSLFFPLPSSALDTSTPLCTDVATKCLCASISTVGEGNMCVDGKVCVWGGGVNVRCRSGVERDP